MTQGAVRLETAERVATLTLERPPLNILGLEELRQLDAALAQLPEATQVLVLRGGGERAFSAGVAIEDHVGDRIGPALELLHRSVRRLRDLPAITLARVHGHCLGGGLEIAVACDLLVAAADARLGTPEIQLGCYPPVAAALYPSRMGRARALELLATGRTFTPEEGLALGLVTRVAPPGELDAAVEALVAGITRHSAAATALLKRVVRRGEELPFDAALEEAERTYLEELTRTEDMHEGIRSFLDKRPPSWRHR